MPNNMVDGNARKWEEDNMNTGSMGAVQNKLMSNGMSQIFLHVNLVSMDLVVP